MTAITHSLYERYVLRVETTRLEDLRHLLAPTEGTKLLPAPSQPGYTIRAPRTT